MKSNECQSAQRAKPIAILLAGLFVGALSLAGCSVQQTVSGWFGGTPPPEAAAGAGQVYYAGEADLKVRSEPSSSSRLVGRLALHEKVTRYKIEHGYAYVKSHTSGVTGWVNNAMLIWRLPAASAAGGEAAPEVPAEPVVEEPDEAPDVVEKPQSPEPPPAPADAPAAGVSPTPSAPAPSLFDPY